MTLNFAEVNWPDSSSDEECWGWLYPNYLFYFYSKFFSKLNKWQKQTKWESLDQALTPVKGLPTISYSIQGALLFLYTVLTFNHRQYE